MNAREPQVTWAYSKNAKTRIAELGNKIISEFLAEVPAADRKKAYACIKTIPGFRPDNDLGLKEKGRRLVSALTQVPDANSKSHTAEWTALSFAWLGWGKHQFPLQFPEPTGEQISNEHEALTSFLRSLVPENNFSVCREDVERLLLFSPFAMTESIKSDIAGMPTRVALEEAKKAAKIPVELDSLKRQFASRENDIAELRDSMNVIRTQSESLHRTTEELHAHVAELMSELSKMKLAQKSAHLQSDEASRVFEQNLRKLETDLSNTVDVLKIKFDDATERAEIIIADVGSNSEAVRRMESAVASLQEATVTSTDSPASRALTPVDTTQTRYPNIRYKLDGLTQGRAELPLTLFHDAKSAHSVLTRNLTAIGVRKVDAVLVAATVLTGVVTGQLVQFTGSFAELMVEAVSTALSANGTLFWRVPLGLQDGSETDFVLAQLNDDPSFVGCIAVVGVNKSAFEIYGDRLANSVAKSQLGIRSSLSEIPLLATFANGSGILPAGPELCCLGPVVDSDTVIWGRANKHATITTGRLNSVSWTELIEPAKTDEDVEQVIRSLSSFGFSSKLWERSARNAVLALRSLDKLVGKGHSENFLRHWLLPWARANETPTDVLRELVTKMESSWFDESVIESVLPRES